MEHRLQAQPQALLESTLFMMVSHWRLSCFAHSFRGKTFEGQMWQIKQQPSPTEGKIDCKASGLVFE